MEKSIPSRQHAASDGHLAGDGDNTERLQFQALLLRALAPLAGGSPCYIRAALVDSSTPRHTTGGHFGSRCVALAWAAMLRIQVSKQVRLIEAKAQYEAVAEERQRIAREFHDTLEQELAGLSIRLDAALPRVPDEKASGLLTQLRTLLIRMQTETRDFILDLRETAPAPLAESLQSLVDRSPDHHGYPVETRDGESTRRPAPHPPPHPPYHPRGGEQCDQTLRRDGYRSFSNSESPHHHRRWQWLRPRNCRRHPFRPPGNAGEGEENQSHSQHCLHARERNNRHAPSSSFLNTENFPLTNSHAPPSL